MYVRATLKKEVENINGKGGQSSGPTIGGIDKSSYCCIQLGLKQLGKNLFIEAKSAISHAAIDRAEGIANSSA